MKTKLNILIILAMAVSLVGGAVIPLFDTSADVTTVGSIGSVDLTGYSNPKLTAVDPLALGISGDVVPARPFLYSVDANGITITRFNDNQVVGAWPWPESTWIEKPDGTIMKIFAPEGGWGAGGDGGVVPHGGGDRQPGERDP